MTDAVLASLPKDQTTYYQDVPAWATAAFALQYFQEPLELYYYC